MREEWRDVPGYEGLYEVSNYGEVRSLRENTRIIDKEGRIMHQKFDNRGYLRVNLYKNGRCESALVSRLVALAFIPNSCNYPEVGHDDDCKTNNRVDNLYWTNRSENLMHNNLHLRIRDKRSANGLARVIEVLSIPVIGTNIQTGEEIRFSSMQEASRHGFDSGKISMCCAGIRNSHRGYTWRKDV